MFCTKIKGYTHSCVTFFIIFISLVDFINPVDFISLAKQSMDCFDKPKIAIVPSIKHIHIACFAV